MPCCSCRRARVSSNLFCSIYLKTIGPTDRVSRSGLLYQCSACLLVCRGLPVLSLSPIQPLWNSRQSGGRSTAHELAGAAVAQETGSSSSSPCQSHRVHQNMFKVPGQTSGPGLGAECSVMEVKPLPPQSCTHTSSYPLITCSKEDQ